LVIVGIEIRASPVGHLARLRVESRALFSQE
jgi:hypothetical protein